MKRLAWLCVCMASLGCEAKVVTHKNLDPAQDKTKHIYPDDHRGWAYVVYDVAGAPALPQDAQGRTEARYPADGCLLTSSKPKKPNDKYKDFVFANGKSVPRIDLKATDDTVGVSRAESRIFAGADTSQIHFDVSFIGTAADANKTKKRSYKGGYPCRTQLEARKK